MNQSGGGLDASGDEVDAEIDVEDDKDAERVPEAAAGDESQEERTPSGAPQDLPEDGEEEFEGDPARGARAPHRPSVKEVEEHNLTHCPPRAWCDHCVKGQFKDRAHVRAKGEDAESEVPRINMDYFMLQDEVSIEASEHVDRSRARVSMTCMCMQESSCRSVWSYAVSQKGAGETWMVQQVADDIATVGLARERVIVKSDQEASMTDVQNAIVRARSGFGTALENSNVGDSNTNGRVERAIQDVKGLIRTLRSFTEEMIGGKIALTDPIVPWMVRHAGHLITRCRIRDNGRTAYQLIKGRRTTAKLIPFGEVVLLKIPKTQHALGDFQDRWQQGVWVGFMMRSGEHVVATRTGTFTVSTVMRRAEGKQWSSELLKDIRGSPGEPIPGSGSRKLQAFAKKFEDAKPDERVFMPVPEVEQQVRAAYIYKDDIELHGPTPKCAGCRATLTGKYRAPHTQECRDRFEALLKATESGRRRVARASQRMTEATVKASGMRPDQGPDEPDPKRSKGEESDSPGGGGETAAASSSRRPQNATAPAASSRSSLPQEPNTGIIVGKKRTAENTDDDRFTNRGDADLELAPRVGQRTGVLPSPALPGVPTQGTKRTAQEDADESGRTDEPEVGQASQDMEDDVTAKGTVNTLIGSKRSVSESPPCADEAGGPVQFQDASWHPVEPKLLLTVHKTHPSPMVKKKEMKKGDLEWRDIGSGVFAKTFLQADRLTVSGKGGPPAGDVARRVVRNLNTGKIVDDCVPDEVPDAMLTRQLPQPEDIRIELTMKGALQMYNRMGPDVCELYSQPRIAQEAAMSKHSGVKLSPGWSLDLTRNDPLTDRPWDLSNHASRERVRQLVNTTKPMMIIGSPPCTAFSLLQGLSRHKRDAKIVQQEMDQAIGHLKFCIEIYRIQMKAGRLFMHEHPHSASSWKMKEVLEIMAMSGVGTVTIDMCAFGMVAVDQDGEAPAKKTTSVMSNSPEVLKSVSRKCANGDPSRRDEHHRHVQLVGGKAKACQIYPRDFCRAVCQGVASEKKLRELGMQSVDILSVDEIMSVDPSQEIHEYVGEEAFDDTSGSQLVPSMVAAARREEIEYFRQMGVYRKVHRDECWQATGKGPIQVRWVDINKGDETRPNYRSRLVAKEFKTDVRPDLYAPTPPGECLRLMLSRLASRKNAKLMYADVSRAYFYAKAVRPVYVVLPQEDRQPGDEELCGELVMSMYGTRDAALNWTTEYSNTLIESGYIQGQSNGCLFYHPGRDVAIMVHGDDFVAVGSDEGLADARASIEGKYKLKVETLGSGKGCTQEVRILNKIVRYTPTGIELEADPRHAELVVRELGLENAKSSRTPGTKDVRKKEDKDEECQDRLAVISEKEYLQSLVENSNKNDMSPIRMNTAEAKRLIEIGERVEIRGHGSGTVRGIGCCGHGAGKAHIEYEDGTSHHCEIASMIGKGEMTRSSVMKPEMPIGEMDEEHEDEVEEPLGPAEARKYRGIAARLNYLAPDRIDIQYAVKESARAMSSPKASDWPKLHRLGRYLLGRPRLVIEFPWQNEPSMVTAYTDSDWAGCIKTARSTSGGIIMIGDHVIKTYSKQQKTIALSSAEAELYAMVAASAEALAIIAYAGNLGMKLEGEVFTDSSAALGISQRAGIGKVRHLRTQGLWVQECRVTGRLKYHKVLGTKNPADVLTKHVPGELLDRHLETIGARLATGRAESAPEISSVESRVFEVEWTCKIDGGDKSQVGRKVSFHNIVKFRGIPSDNRGRKCGNSRRSNLEKDKPDLAERRRQIAGGDAIHNVQGEPNMRRSSSTMARCPACGCDGSERWGDEEEGADDCTACAASGRLFNKRAPSRKFSEGVTAPIFSLDSVVFDEHDFVRRPKVTCGVTSLPISRSYRIRPVRTRGAKTECIRSCDYVGVNRPGRALLGARSGNYFREFGFRRANFVCVNGGRSPCIGRASEGERWHLHTLCTRTHDAHAHMFAHICAAQTKAIDRQVDSQTVLHERSMSETYLLRPGSSRF